MTGSGRTGRKATHRQQAAHTGAQRATASIRPEPLSLSSPCGTGSSGWGETPLERVQLIALDQLRRHGVVATLQQGQRQQPGMMHGPKLRLAC
jgi:hypothetical protein